MAKARDILLKLTGDSSSAKRALDDVKGELSSFDKIKAEARAEIKTVAAKAELEKLTNRLERFGAQTQTADVKIKTAKTLEQIERIEKKLRDIKDQDVTVRVKEERQGGERGERGGSSGAIGVAGLAGRLGPVGLAAGAVAAGGVVGIKSITDAAAQSEVSQAKLQAQLKATGISYAENAKEIDKVIQATSNLSGLDDEDLQDSFTNIVRATGDVSEALKLTGLAADFARAKNIDVAKAGEIFAKVAGGNTGVLKRYGVTVKEGATAQEALAEAQKTFGGQAKAFGDTAAGAQEKFKVASENLRESIGSGLTPVLADLASGAVKAVAAVQVAFPRIKEIIGDAFAVVRGFFRRNRRDINGVIAAFRNIAKVVKAVFTDVVIPIIQAALPGIRRALTGIIRIARGVIRIFTGIFTGDFKRVTDGLKDIVAGSLRALRGAFRAGLDTIVKVIRGAGSKFLNAGKSLGRKLVEGLKSIFSSGGALAGDLGKSIANAVIDLLNSAIPNKLPIPGAPDIDLPNNPIPRFARGGLVRGVGSADTVPALLTPGEFVLRRSAVQALGAGALGSLNAGRVPASGMTVNASISVPGGGPPDPRALAVALAREGARRR